MSILLGPIDRKAVADSVIARFSEPKAQKPRRDYRIEASACDLEQFDHYGYPEEFCEDDEPMGGDE